MAVARSEWDDWADEVAHCLEVVRDRDEYAARVAALRRLRELAADAEEQLVHERFVDDDRRRCERGRRGRETPSPIR